MHMNKKKFKCRHPNGTLNTRGVGYIWRFSTNVLMHLRNGARQGHR